MEKISAGKYKGIVLAPSWRLRAPTSPSVPLSAAAEALPAQHRPAAAVLCPVN